MTEEDQTNEQAPTAQPEQQPAASKKKYTIEYDREGCIGAAACAALAPDNWVMAQDGKADLLKREITEDELEINKEAAESCPVNVIKIKDEDGNYVG